MAVILALLMMAIGPPDDVRTVAHGTLSGIDAPRRVVVRTEAEWRDLWKAHAPGQAMPAVDFSARTIVAVFLGSRTSAGFGVTITGVDPQPGGAVVRYREARPAPGAILAQVLTTPFHIVSVPRFEGTATFLRDDGR